MPKSEETAKEGNEKEIKCLNRLIGYSQKSIITSILNIAPSNLTVLITGETGTGKSLVAEAIHEESRRNKGPFVYVNCGAIPENLIESELYGHKKGSFTGADRDRQGKFAMAAGGTIFLDEIGDMPLMQQTRLLRILDNRKYEPVGSDTTVPLDARIITATNRNLEELIEINKFRKDLFYRLNVLRIHLPPLRQRKNDIPELIDFFVSEFKKKHELHANIPDEIIAQIKSRFPYKPWEGNVRELMHAIERRILQGETIDGINNRDEETDISWIDGMPISIKKATKMLERININRALNMYKGNKTKAAAELEISLPALFYKMKEHENEKP